MHLVSKNVIHRTRLRNNINMGFKVMRMINSKSFSALFIFAIVSPYLGFCSEPRIVRIEEDWELEVITPDPLQDSPQISTWLSPNGSLDGDYFGANLNHAQKADYQGGGFQTIAFQGTALIDERLNCKGIKLSTNGECIKWTQVMAIVNKELVFAIKNGASNSWGEFGGPDSLVRVSSSVDNLGGYSPSNSVKWSGVGFAANRVALLKLAKVRYTTNLGQVSELTVNLRVH